MIGILVEKPSAKKNFAKALGGVQGTFDSEKFIICNSVGHLYHLSTNMEDQVAPALVQKYTKWSLEELPWNMNDFSWKMVPGDNVRLTIDTLVSTLNGCDEIVIATDNDPSGEGEMIAWEILWKNHINAPKYTRMYFADESVASIQKAFRERKLLGTDLNCMYRDADFRKALFRTRWDFLSIQWTRIASIVSRKKAVLRNGRLKSAMMVLVGDQLEAVKNYRKKSFFQQAFKDENGVVYLDPKGKKADSPDELEQIPNGSEVCMKSKTIKYTAPPAFLDLSALSAKLAAEGIQAETTLKTYQAMYEDSIVSYPRTEDKHITEGQFAELDRCVDAIADLIGVDKELLTHRNSPRKTHIREGLAHGANRPGSVVPESIDGLDQKYGTGASRIYTILARSYLATLCDDYQYEHQEGFLKDYPTYTGDAKVPMAPGWKAVYEVDTDDPEDKDENGSGLGTYAQPFIKEGANKKPNAPTMKWLMKQLEKWDVGTGATRTKTYADITDANARYPLMSEKRGRISFTELGEVNYGIIKGTHIGDLTMTERVYNQMKEVENGKDSREYLKEIEGLVKEDIATMSENARYSNIQKEKAMGNWNNTEISFNREWGGHRFADEEVTKLLAGDTISFEKQSSDGSVKMITGKLAQLEYNGFAYVGFSPSYGDHGSSSEITKMKCPKCGQLIRKYSWGYACSARKENCGFALGYNFGNNKLTDTQLKSLIKKGMTAKPVSLISKNGSPYQAFMKLDKNKDYRISVEFVRK